MAKRQPTTGQNLHRRRGLVGCSARISSTGVLEELMHLAFERARRLAAIVVGRAGMDLYPLPDGVETEQAQTFAAEVGGSAANIAVAVARQDQPVALLGALSDDAVGRFVRSHLQRYAIDISHCRTVSGASRTSLAICETRPEDSETVFYRNGAADLELQRDDFDQAFIASASFLVITGTALAAEPSRSAAIQALALARDTGTFSILDIDYRSVSWNSTDEAMRIVADAGGRCDAVVGNDEEFGLIAGSGQDPLEAARGFVRAGRHFVIFKKGNAGSITVTADKSFETSIFAVDAKKPFGSGDAFLGSLIVGLRAGNPLESAVRRAAAGAAFVVARRGCAFAMPSAAELDSFILSYQSKGQRD